MHPLSFAVAFVAGLASILSPCVAPLVPSYLTAMAGTPLNAATVQRSAVRHQVLSNSVAFIVGFSLILIASGLVATSVGQFLHRYQALIAEVGGVLLIVFGLELLDIIQIGLFARQFRWHGPTRAASPLLMGIIFAAGWTPCVGPIWSSILVLAAKLNTVTLGAALLATYALGLALPFFTLALFISRATGWVRSMARFVTTMQKGSGLLLIALGLLLALHLYGQVAAWV